MSKDENDEKDAKLISYLKYQFKELKKYLKNKRRILTMKINEVMTI